MLTTKKERAMLRRKIIAGLVLWSSSDWQRGKKR